MMDYEALARQFGGTVAGPAPTAAPAAPEAPVSPAAAPMDYQALATQFGGQMQPAAVPEAPAVPEAAMEPETTISGLGGAVTRGLAVPAAGAALGAMAGAPFGGVGAVPGAAAGAAAATIGAALGDPIVGAINNLFGTKYTLPTDAMEDLLTRLGVPEARTEAERIVESAAAGAGMATGAAAAGQVLQATARSPAARAIGGAFAAQPAAQVAGGAAGGAAGAAAGEAGMGPAAQIGASLVGGMAGARVGGMIEPQVGQPPAVRPGTMEEAERLDVPVMTSDVYPPRTFIGQSAQRFGERIPVAGTGGARVQQEEARMEAIRKTLRDFDVEDEVDLSPRLMTMLSDKRAADLGRYTANKKEVIERLAPRGDVPINRALNELDNQIEALSRRRTPPSEEAIDELNKIREGLAGRNLAELEAYRRDVLGQVFKTDPASTISVGAREVGEQALRAIYNPLVKDMGDFIRSAGNRRDYDKWMVANKRLSELAGEAGVSRFRNLLRTGEATPENINNLLFSVKPSEVQMVYKALPPEGRAVARSAILSRIADKARFERDDGTIGYSPLKFKTEFERRSPQVDVFFKGRDREQVEGLIRVLNLTRRASTANVATPTGQEAMPFLAGGALTDILGGMGRAVVGAGGLGLTARVYESKPVRDLMLKLGRTRQGSREEAAIYKRLLSTIQTQSEAIGEVAEEAREMAE